MAEARRIPCLYVLAGMNGAGRSSIASAMLRQRGIQHFDPDAAARLITARNPGITKTEANGAAWHEARRLLERAIAERLNFSFETTLGGNTITALLEPALDAGSHMPVACLGSCTDPALGLACSTEVEHDAGP